MRKATKAKTLVTKALVAKVKAPALVAKAKAKASGAPLTPRQYAALDALRTCGLGSSGVTIRHLCDMLGVTTTAARRHLSNLTRKGYLEVRMVDRRTRKVLPADVTPGGGRLEYKATRLGRSARQERRVGAVDTRP